ncbi:spore coat U domain-containing protein [Acinetobacter sp. TAC-1]|uniref:Csu type fimbrial protein n=1 Tax=Acinetobacter sp. TAC-1 TaxID=3027470 RepID=UPI0023AA54EC|nr:spore coat U domain-containing protein [Acinetobacter sp. TAC-1]WEE40856.1 spore coat U domain-containing protein [Acinetobacter sp. TAC-1]
MITLKKIILAGLLFSGLILITAQSYADCSVNSSGNVSIGKVPSITLAENGVQSSQFSAGLSCGGFSLALANMTYLKYRVDQMPANYINSVTGERLIVNYLDTNSNPINVGQERDLSSFTIINFFTGPNGSLPFYAKINPGQTVSPGIYRSETPFKVKWYYSVPAIAVIGIGFFFESPGFKRPGIFSDLNWGSGSDASLNLSIEVLPDCRIATNDVNFGTAAFASEFQPVKTSMGIRCSVKTPYKVSLNDGLYPQNGNQRAMKSETGNNYMSYEIYKNSTTERWGRNNEQWLSDVATTNPGIYDGNTQQGYAFTTKILDTNSLSLPAGKYSDTVTVQVEF